MRYLITGAAGFVGSTLIRNLLDKYSDISICGIDNMSYGYHERIIDIKDKFEFIEGDICNIRQILRDKKFDVIIHCAAIAPLPECQSDSYRALVQNVAICGSIADYALYSGTSNIIFFSSGAVYEGVDVYPTPENVNIKPRLVYPTTKYLAEEFFASMCRSHDLNVVAIRLFNLYGPRQDYFRKQPPLIGYLIKTLLENKTATLFSNGEQKRDYIYIDDLINLIEKISINLSDRNVRGEFDVINAGSGNSISVNEIISILEKISNKSISIHREDSSEYWSKYNDIFNREINLKTEILSMEVNKYTNASLIKSREKYKWEAKVDMIKGLAACFNYARKIL